MQVGYEKSLLSTTVLLHRMLSMVQMSYVINTVPVDRGKLVILMAGVCVLQHSSEAHLTVLLWPFLAARCCAIHTQLQRTINRDLHIPYSMVLF